MLDDPQFFTVTDLKQFTYCARVVYYEQCLPHIRPRTYKMDAGRDAHEAEQKRAARRTMAQYKDVPAGERVFNLRLFSTALRLTGELDEVVYSTTGEVVPVDYKLAKRTSWHYKVQLAAYALMLEVATAVAIERGFLYLIPTRKMVEIRLKQDLREQVIMLLNQMRDMVEHETMPEPAANANHCVNCEFRRFCNDVP
jgi:CRISPR-associated exonuclease Cas4